MIGVDGTLPIPLINLNKLPSSAKKRDLIFCYFIFRRYFLAKTILVSSKKQWSRGGVQNESPYKLKPGSTDSANLPVLQIHET